MCLLPLSPAVKIHQSEPIAYHGPIPPARSLGSYLHFGEEVYDSDTSEWQRFTPTSHRSEGSHRWAVAEKRAHGGNFIPGGLLIKSIGLFQDSIKKKKRQGRDLSGSSGHASAPRQDPLGPCSSRGSPQQHALASPWPYCRVKLALGLNNWISLLHTKLICSCPTQDEHREQVPLFPFMTIFNNLALADCKADCPQAHLTARLNWHWISYTVLLPLWFCSISYTNFIWTTLLKKRHVKRYLPKVRENWRQGCMRCFRPRDGTSPVIENNWSDLTSFVLDKSPSVATLWVFTSSCMIICSHTFLG